MVYLQTLIKTIYKLDLFIEIFFVFLSAALISRKLDMHFQRSIITAGLAATIVQAQGLESGYNYNDLLSANNPLKESAFDDFGYYYDTPSSFFSPFNPGRVGPSFPDPYSWYFYHNGLPPSPYPRPGPPFFNFGPYGGSVWNQRSPSMFDPIAGFPFLNRGPNYYDTIYGNGVYTKNPNAGKAYDSGNNPIINGHDSANDNINSRSIFGGSFPFPNGPRNSDGFAIIDGTISNDKGSGLLVPKRKKLNPGKPNPGDKKIKVVPKVPLKKEGETTLKPVEGKPAQDEHPNANPINSTPGAKESTNQESGEEKSAQQDSPTNEESTGQDHPKQGAEVVAEEHPIKEDPIEQPIEKDTIEPENDESTLINEPED